MEARQKMRSNFIRKQTKCTDELLTKESIKRILLDPNYGRFESNGVVICDQNECGEYAFEIYINGVRFAGANDADSLIERFLRIVK